MTGRSASITQAELARAIKAAKQAGATEVEIKLGEASVIIRLPAGEAPVPNSPEAEIVL